MNVGYNGQDNYHDLQNHCFENLYEILDQNCHFIFSQQHTEA